MSQLFNIDEIPEESLDSVGGKARGLNALCKFGFEVPKAFIITDIQEGEDFKEAIDKYEADGYDEVSVRSSATLEDGDDFSAAGQFSTVLNVSGRDRLLSAIHECVDSLHNENVEQYSKTFLRSAKCRMTVVVQQMVDARSAGVIFTKAPMRPGFTLVEAVPGLGENLVSGKMSAQQYRIRGSMVENMPQNAILTKKEAVELGRSGFKAEKLFGKPMDLEWAIDQSGKINWLQARAITISESVTMNELDCNLEASNFVYTTGNVGEMMPGAVTPLTLSTNMYALDWGVRQTYIEIGCTGEEVKPFSYIASYYNHMFFNMTNMYKIAHTTYGTSKDTMDVAICGHVLEGFPDIDMKDAGTFRRLRNTAIFLKIVFGGERAKQGMNKVVEGLHFNLEDSAEGLYKQLTDNFEALKMAQYYHYCASYYSGGQSNMLNMLEKDFEDKERFKNLVCGCLTQIDDFESANVLRQMNAMCEIILRENPDSVNMDTEALCDYVENRSGKQVREAYDEFIRRHGHRGIREAELMSLPWRMDKKSLFSSLRSVLCSMGEGNAKKETPWTQYADEILARYHGIKRNMVKGFIDKARRGVCFREYTKSRSILVLDRFKQAYSQLSSLLVKQGVLPEENLIYFLMHDEIGDLIAGNSALVKKAMARKRLYPGQNNLKFPYCTMGVPQPIPPSPSKTGTTTFQGTPVSRGTARGIARIVRTEQDAALLQKGEIMVAACTDIGWTPYYNTISGIVTEIGSALSHGIVVAREYALPAVVNASNVMQLIHTGDEITIDGNTGRVVIEKREPAK